MDRFASARVYVLLIFDKSVCDMQVSYNPLLFLDPTLNVRLCLCSSTSAAVNSSDPLVWSRNCPTEMTGCVQVRMYSTLLIPLHVPAVLMFVSLPLIPLMWVIADLVLFVKAFLSLWTPWVAPESHIALDPLIPGFVRYVQVAVLPGFSLIVVCRCVFIFVWCDW